MAHLYLLLLTVYSFGLLWLTRKWNNLKEFGPTGNFDRGAFISVIIPVRNESENIEQLLSSIEKQTLSKESFEVIVVDDDSSDDTFIRVQDYACRSELDLKVISSEPGKSTPKKRALSTAISVSQGDIIVTTDGDCIAKRRWLESVNGAFDNSEIQMVLGSVTYTLEGFLDRLQWIEFSALQGLSALLLSMERPAMGNGANLAYRKSTFLSVGQFDGNDHIATGDDEFLVRKIATKYGSKSLQYLKSKDALIDTIPAKGLRQIINQKTRWSSKWKVQKESTAWLLPLAVLCINLLPIIGLVGIWAGYLSISTAVFGWLIKGFGDMIFARTIAGYFG
ncbi:MAG: glycosyltransferase, partial [Bacteroidota bacterium]